MKKSMAGGIAFILVGVAFMVMAVSGQRTYLPIGAAFVVIGLVFIVRRRRTG
jgi:drug/metabolite transporter (DMT)-like permease